MNAAQKRSETMKTHQETTLNVEGMSCPSCIRHIDDALREVQGVREVSVLLEQSQVRVKYDATTAHINSLVEALKDAGYEAAPAA
jgi:copper chaperone